MTDSKRVAGLLGPSLIAITLSEMLNAHIWAAIIAPVTYQAGALWFVAGLAIVRAHNNWRRGWPVIITLVGWFAILGGLFRMSQTPNRFTVTIKGVRSMGELRFEWP